MAKKSSKNKFRGGDPTEKREKKPNPFEEHINRVKHSVLGRKIKSGHGMPGVARAKGIRKRDNTLLQEYRQRHKSNVFLDRRIGENNPRMDPEKKIALRLAAEKKKQFGKKSMFNLNDEEELTHKGLTLDGTNMNEKLTLSDDEDDNLLDSKFVKEQHFGGFMTKREDGELVEDPNKRRSRKEWIENIIAESKRKKAESQKLKEEQHETVTKLDSKIQNFMLMMAGYNMTDEDKQSAQKKSSFQDYDTLVRELQFDRTGKAKATDKLKTAEQIAKEERERLLALEADRVRRMKGEEVKDVKMKSADDLDDGFTMAKPLQVPLSYKNGKILTEEEDEEEKEDSEEDGEEEREEGSDEEMDEEGEEGEEDGESEVEEEEEEEENGEVEVEGEEENEGSEVEGEEEENKGSEAEGEEEEGEEENEDESDDDDDDESDKYSDILEESASESEEEEEKLPKQKTKTLEKKEMMEAAKKELPYTFEVPQDYEAFWALLENHSPGEVNTILDRMIKCNHPSLGAENKSKCEDVFAYLLQTLNMLTEYDGDAPMNGISPFMYVEGIIPHLYTLTQLSTPNAARALLQVIKEKYGDCLESRFRRYPMADTFVFLKVAGMLFPPSDFIHPVMIPVMAFLCNMLGQCKITNYRDICAALFTAYLTYEYMSLSKRFIPELTNVLNGLLFMAIPLKDKTKLPLTPPFKPVGPTASLLVPNKPVKEFKSSKLTFASINNSEEEMTNDFKVNALQKTLELIQKVCNCWSEHRAIRNIMKPTTELLKSLQLKKLPESVKESVRDLQNTIKSLPSQGLRLCKESEKPKSIAMFEPHIEQVIDGVKKRFGTKEKLERDKLVYKVKRERKALKREILKDTAYLAREKLKDQLEKDAVRKRKVNLIMSGLQSQESDIKKLKFRKKFT